MHTLKKLLPISLILSLAVPASAQNGPKDGSLEATLLDMLGNNAELYLGPLATAFGTGMNSGTFRRARPHKILGIDATVNFVIATVPDAGLVYNFYVSKELSLPIPLGGTTYSVPFDGDLLFPLDERETPTFFGDSKGVTLEPDANYAFATTKSFLVGQGVPSTAVDAAETTIKTEIAKAAIPTTGGFFPAAFPNIIPQVALGLPFGTEIMFRGFTIPIPDTDDSFSMTGFGAKFYLNKVLPTIPLVFPAMSIGYYQTSVDLAGVITSTNNIINFQLSKSVPFLTVYGGVGIENSSVSVTVSDTNGDELFGFDLDGKNSFRTIVGGRLKFFLLSINFDVNAGEYTAYNLGVGLTFR